MSTSRVPGSASRSKSKNVPAAASPAAAAPTESARQNRKGKRYPVWSVRWLFVSFVIGVAVTILLVILFDRHHHIVRDMEITLALVAALLFIFMSIGLYCGARVRKSESITSGYQFVSGPGFLKGTDASGCLDVGDLFSGSSEGCGEALGGLVIGILLLILLVVGLWLFLNVAIIVMFLLSVAVGWAFHRAFRQVFARSRKCRGDLVSSLYFAAVYTFLYTGWLFLILWATDFLMKRHKPPTVETTPAPVAMISGACREI